MKSKFLSNNNRRQRSHKRSNSFCMDSTGAFSPESEEFWCQEPVQNNKTITFKKRASARLQLSRKEYTPEEIAATWYTSEEYVSIRRECLKQILKMENGGTFKDKKYCSRGLENHTRVKSICRMQNKKDSFRAVLDEQAEQQRNGIVDAERIAKRYHQVTTSCQLWACIVGLQDQLMVD